MDSALGSVIDWQSPQSHLQLNPRWPQEDQALFHKLANEYSQDGHIWICSSGSTSSVTTSVKLIALAKQAFLVSAEAVNKRLQSGAEDTWALSLPLFHVGGLGILARAHLSGAKVADLRSDSTWDPLIFFQALVEQKVTLSALVPTQLNDLVKLKKIAPPSLRAVIIGGAALSESLFKEARALGWPVLPSFGMTEACSQIATAELSSLQSEEAPLILLDHLTARLDDHSRLAIKGESLLSGYAQISEDRSIWVDPKKESWFISDDRGILDGRVFVPAGRGSDFVQVGGETVNLLKLRSVLAEELRGLTLAYDFEILGLPCDRLGSKIVLAHTAGEEPLGLVESFNERVLPYEKIRESYAVGFIPRTELKKIRAGELIQSLALAKPSATY